MQIPSKEQVDALSAELAERGSSIPAHVDTMLTSLPPGTHPMTQFSMAVLALQVREHCRIPASLMLAQNPWTSLSGSAAKVDRFAMVHWITVNLCANHLKLPSIC